MTGPTGLAPTAPLLERDPELAALKRALAAARRGEGGAVIVAGDRGTGKTSLLEACRAFAARTRMLTLTAACSAQEREFSFGVARQLLARAQAEIEAGDGAEVLRDPAAEADAFARFEALHSLVAALATRAPVLITVDDLESCDAESLAFLAFLARRIEELPIALILAGFATGPFGERDPAAAFAGTPGLLTLALADLSEEATATLIAARIGTRPDDAFTALCRRATGGNPWLLAELAEAAAAEGLAPAADSAGRVAELAPPGISRSVLARLEPEARAVARAAAVLGSESELAEVASLAEMTPAAAGAAADALVSLGVFVPDAPIGFVRPIVRAAVYADLLPHERAAAHARAARLMAERGRPHRVVTHLLAAEPSGDGWLVEQLERAAVAAMRDGDPGLAWRLLVRALAEPPGPGDRPRLLFAAGVASARGDGADAVTLLTEALELEHDPERRAAITLELAQNLAYGGRAGRAARLLLAGIENLGAEQPLRDDLEALLLAFAATTTSARRIAGDRLGRFSSATRERDPEARPLLASLALEQVTAGGTAPEAISLAQRALSGGMPLSERSPGSPLPHLAAAALLWADRVDLAEEAASRALAAARAGASVVGETLALTTRALIRFRGGDLAGAAADADAALALEALRGEQVFVVPAAATRAEVLIERGELAEAGSALILVGPVAHDPEALLTQPLREARARLWMAQGNPAAALAELGSCEERERSWGAPAVAPVAWRSESAMAHLALGRLAEARRLADEELILAREFGAPRAIGIALRACGMVGAGESRTRSLELLREACATLTRSGDRLERARTAIELGSALRRAGRRSESRERLSEGLEVARSCGATVLVERAYAELAAGGSRRRKILRSGVSELTVSERRVAAMAAEGMTNREIGEALVVTVKTVESHLGHAYRKLEIRSRRDLARALAGQALGTSSSSLDRRVGD